MRFSQPAGNVGERHTGTIPMLLLGRTDRRDIGILRRQSFRRLCLWFLKDARNWRSGDIISINRENTQGFI